MTLSHAAFIAGFSLLLMGVVGTSLAAGPLFTGGFMGLNLSSVTPHDNMQINNSGASPAFAGSLGFRLAPKWRVGGEVTYNARGNSDGETQSRLALVNLYYDFNGGKGRFQPFLSIGAGLANHDFYRGGMDGLGIASTTSTQGVWQAGAGLNYRISDDVSLSGGYRHLGYSNSATTYDASPSGSHELRAGITWKFPVKRNHDSPSGKQ